MKLHNILAFFFGFLFMATYALAQSATTDPLGFLTINITAGTGTAKRTSLISAPLLDTASINGTATGSITSITSTSLTCATAGWTPGALSRAATPFLVQITSGNATGHIFLISNTIKNTSTTLTISAEDQVNTKLTMLGIKTGANGDTFKIIPCDTLLSFLGTPQTIGVRAGANATVSDTVTTVVNGVSTTYFYSSTLNRWTRNAPGNADASNVTLRPYAGFAYARLASTPLSLIVTGNVPIIGRKVPIKNSGLTYLSQYFPVETTLAVSGINNLANWKSGANATISDTVTIITSGVSSVYFHNGTNWVKNAPGFPISNSLLIPAGASIIINKRGTAPQSIALTQQLPYSL